MDTKKRLYIVSFGDSDKYRYEYTEPEGADALLHRPDPFQPLEKRLGEYLAKRFPGKSFADLISARATEVLPGHAGRYAGYPLLDEKAISRIEEILSNEAANREDQKELDSNAPWADINPNAQ